MEQGDALLAVVVEEDEAAALLGDEPRQADGPGGGVDQVVAQQGLVDPVVELAQDERPAQVALVGSPRGPGSVTFGSIVARLLHHAQLHGAESPVFGDVAVGQPREVQLHPAQLHGVVSISVTIPVAAPPRTAGAAPDPGPAAAV